MEKIILNAKKRETAGKEANKKLRVEGLIPAVVCKRHKKSVSLAVNEHELTHILHTSAGENAVITLCLKEQEGQQKKEADERTTIIKEIQYHPITEKILHVDFQEISLKENITVTVPIELRGESFGVKTEGGVLNHVLKDLEIECLPTEIPEKITLDVTNLKIGDIVIIKELSIPAGVNVLADPEQAVVSVDHPAEIKEEVSAEEGEEALQEPEVIRERKPEEAEEEGAPEAEQKNTEKKPKEK